MKISDFEKKLAQGKQAREQLTNEINDLLRQESELKAEALACADAGDVDGYQEKSTEQARVTATIFVKRRLLDKQGPAVSEADARDAWASYVAAYDKKLREGLAAFEAQKEKLCQQYSELLALQEEALAVRGRLGAAVGLDKSSFSMNYIPTRSGISAPGLLRLGGCRVLDPDAAYYMACYCVRNDSPLVGQDPEEQRVYDVLVRRN